MHHGTQFIEKYSVKTFISGLGRLGLNHLIPLQKTKFYQCMKLLKHSLLVNVFWIYYRPTDNCHADNELLSIYYARATAINSACEDFRSIVCNTHYFLCLLVHFCVRCVICTFDTLLPAGVINYSYLP
jgi:hypothetical protein